MLSDNKMVSVNQEIASIDPDLIKLGTATKILSKHFNLKIDKNVILQAFNQIIGGTPEWHHSGFFKTSSKSKMGKTYFFKIDEIEELKNSKEVFENVISKNEKKAIDDSITTVNGFYFQWQKKVGNYGKRINFKVLKIYSGLKNSIPKNFTIVENSEIFEKIKRDEGKEYYGWDEPFIREWQ